MTFIEALNNELTRGLIDSIEDLQSSLEAYPNGEPTLERMLKSNIAELAQNGHNWK